MIGNKLKILCIDPGYSLAEANELYLNHNYPGHLLYGTNHLTEQNFEVVFQPNRNAGRIKSEFNTVSDYLKTKPDSIYIPFSDFGGGVISIVRKLRFIKTPVIMLFHGYHEKGKIRSFKDKCKRQFMYFLRRIELQCVDRAIFINKFAFDDFCMIHKGKRILKRVFYCPLQPEIIRSSNRIEKREEGRGVVSIGKTMREYETVLEAAKKYKDFHVTVISPSLSNIAGGGAKNLVFHEKSISFIEMNKEYEKAAIILVPVEETFGGMYGYSSILDALAAGKPILASATIAMGIDIDELNIGRTYQCGDSDDLYNSYLEILMQYEEIKWNINQFILEFNIGAFTKSISNHITTLDLALHSHKGCACK